MIGIAGLAVMLLAVSYFTGAFGDDRRSACAAPGASAVVQAYTLALTNPATLRTFVQANPTLFSADGDAVQCCALLAAALAANTELSQLDAIGERAEAERETGLDFDRAAYTSDLAETLRELTGALSALARADDGPYSKTRAHESAQAYSALVRRAPAASAGIDALIDADADVLRELAERLNEESSP
jgi:hypothetical protein